VVLGAPNPDSSCLSWHRELVEIHQVHRSRRLFSGLQILLSQGSPLEVGDVPLQ
jgi:hypothetical protein